MTTQVALAVFVSLLAGRAAAQTIQGTATYRERMALPARAVFEATLEHVSRADAPSETIASLRLTAPGNPPIAFTIAYEPSKILDNHSYVVRATILDDGKLLFTTDTATPVITRGRPTTVSLLIRRVGTGQAAPPKAAGDRPLEGVRWKAVELAGKPTPAQAPNREAHLVFEASGRLLGSDGCNRLTGNYLRNGDALTFGQMAMTQMACVDAAEIVGGFREAMKAAARFAIVGDRLELFDAAGTRVAAFTAQVQTPPASPELAGTSWQLVKFQGSDDKTLTPHDGAKYTIEFAAGGQLAARIDCNRGRGTWKSSGPNQVQLGPLALTRALCPPGSLHDQIVKHWGYVRSYVVKDGHLFLSLMADGGIYEFEPMKKV
jgi:uncharacterized lipoprotein YbaY